MPIYTGKLSGSGDANIVGNTFIEGNLNVSGTLSGITTLSGSGAVSSGGGGTFAGTLNLQDAGITNAGSIAGATTVTGSGIGSFGSLVLDGPANLQSAGITNAGSIAGATSITAAGDMSITGDTITFTSANATDPLLIIKNTTNDTSCARLRFVKDKGSAGAANDDVGIIQFYGDDASQDQVLFGRIRTRVAVHTNGQEGGKMQFAVASHDGELVAGLTIGDGSGEDEVDVTIGSGADSLTTIAGDLDIPNGGFALGSDADGDVYYRNSGNLQRLAKGDDDQVLTLASGIPSWAAAAAGSTFTNLSGSGILQTVGATILGSTLNVTGNATFGVDDTGVDVRIYSATTNEGILYDASEDELALLLTTKLKFHDVGGGEEIFASADGHLEINAATTLDITAPTVDINASTAVTIDGPSVVISSATSEKPNVEIKNTNADANGPALQFTKNGANVADNDVVGNIAFVSEDDGSNVHMYAAVVGSISDMTAGAEGGTLELKVAEHDGTVTTGLKLQDGNANGEIDVTIGAGNDSLTTIAGDLDIPNGGFALGSDADGDIYYRNSGNLQRLAKGDDDQVLTLASGIPSWAAPAAGSTFTNLSGSGTLHVVGASTFGNTIAATGSITSNSAISGSGAGSFGSLVLDGAANLQSAGITNAGSIAGATTVSGSGAAAFGSLTVDGAVNLQSAGITNAGSIAGATALTSVGDMSVTADTVTFTSANSTDPLVIIKNTTNDANGARLRFVKDKGSAGADGDDIGTIEFYGDDAAQTQTVFAAIVAEVSEADNTDEAGKLTLYVAESDGTTTALAAGLILEGEHATDGEVDVTIGGGASSTTTIVGTSQFNGNATFGVDDTGVDVRLYSATASEGVLYDASEDELALLLTTKLKFHDVGGGEEIYASSNGHLEVNAGTTLDITAPTVDINASTEVTIDTDTVTIGSSNSTDPLVVIKNTTNDANSARLRFVKDKGAAGADNDVVGMIEFVGDDDAQDQVLFGRIAVQVVDASNGAEGGGLSLSVATHDGEMQNGLVLTDGDAEDEIDATIGGGASSLTTVAGNLSVTTNSFVAGYTHYDSTPADAITSGVTATFTAGEDLEIGECAYFKSDGKMWKAVATAAATTACVAMAAADISADATGVFLLKGFLRADTNFPTWTVGGRLYTPEAETSGHNVPEQAAPDTDGDFVQVIGWAVDGNTVYFCPDSTIIEVA
tara:strand:+ start:3809 stop:7414 length:3606 start_codon:yes stop_codon:yes gene_type:complete